MTEGPSKSRLTAVAGESVGLLHTAPLVLAELTIAAAMTRASRSHSGCYLCPLLQVQSDAVQLQVADAAQKAFLSGCSASCQDKKQKMNRWSKRYTVFICMKKV